MGIAVAEEKSTSQPRVQWLWWALTTLLGVGLVIDAIDGPPLKLVTTALLFAACLLSALVRPPRKGLAGAAIVVCFGGALLLVLFRALGPGL